MLKKHLAYFFLAIIFFLGVIKNSLASESMEFKIEFSYSIPEPPLVEIFINNKKYYLTIDTGAPSYISLRADLFRGKPINAFLKDSKNSKFFISNNLIDFDETKEGVLGKTNAAGVLGIDFLSKHNCSINVSEKSLKIFSKKRERTTSALPVERSLFRKKLPFVSLPMKGKRVSFLIDTGGYTSCVQKNYLQYFDNVIFDENSVDQFAVFPYIDKDIRSIDMLLDEFIFIGKKLNLVEFVCLDSENFLNIIGMNILRQFQIDFYENGEYIEFSKVEDLKLSLPYGRMGIRLRRENGSVYADVKKGSPADLKGLLPSDEIIEIDNQEMLYVKDELFPYIIQKPLGLPVPIKFKRDGKVEQIDVSPISFYVKPEKTGHGIGLRITIGEGTFIGTLMVNSIAYKSEIDCGDRIISINGLNATFDKDNLEEITSFIQKFRKNDLDISFIRPGETMIRKVKLKIGELPAIPWRTSSRKTK